MGCEVYRLYNVATRMHDVDIGVVLEEGEGSRTYPLHQLNLCTSYTSPFWTI
jgi:hypothetical protein